MSAYKDAMNPHWRTDALSEELRKAKEKIRQLEAEQRRMSERLGQLAWKVRLLTGEGLP